MYISTKMFIGGITTKTCSANITNLEKQIIQCKIARYLHTYFYIEKKSCDWCQDFLPKVDTLAIRSQINHQILLHMFY
jgi:hypothetical protein